MNKDSFISHFLKPSLEVIQRNYRHIFFYLVE